MIFGKKNKKEDYGLIAYRKTVEEILNWNDHSNPFTAAFLEIKFKDLELKKRFENQYVKNLKEILLEKDIEQFYISFLKNPIYNLIIQGNGIYLDILIGTQLDEVILYSLDLLSYYKAKGCENMTITFNFNGVSLNIDSTTNINELKSYYYDVINENSAKTI